MDTQNRPDRLTFGNIVRNFLQDLTNADNGLWGTVVQLTLRPQKVVHTFLFEDRKQFIRPTRYVLFVFSLMALHFLAMQYRYGEPVHEFLQPELERMIDNNVSKMKASFAELGEKEDASPEVTAYLNDVYLPAFRRNMMAFQLFNVRYSNYISVVLIPVFALFYWFIFPRRGFNYPEHLAAGGYVFAHSGLLSFLLTPFLLITSSPAWLIKGLFIISAVQSIYLIYASVRVYVLKWTDVLVALGLAFWGFVCLYVSLANGSRVIGYLTGKDLAGCVSYGFSFRLFLVALIPLFFWATFLLFSRRPHRWPWALGLGLLSAMLYFIA